MFLFNAKRTGSTREKWKARAVTKKATTWRGGRACRPQCHNWGSKQKIDGNFPPIFHFRLPPLARTTQAPPPEGAHVIGSLALLSQCNSLIPQYLYWDLQIWGEEKALCERATRREICWLLSHSLPLAKWPLSRPSGLPSRRLHRVLIIQ
jgi:hypothetical protein